MRYKLLILVAVVIGLGNIVACTYLVLTPDSLLPPYWERVVVATWAISTIVYVWSNHILKQWGSERLNNISSDPVD